MVMFWKNKAPPPRLRFTATFDLIPPDLPCEVFISYARKEERQAVVIDDLLSEFGFSVYRDRKQLDAGDNYPKHLWDAISRSRAVVALLSNTAVTRPWVLRECEWALQNNKLLACAIESIHDESMPTLLRNLHLTDISKERIGAHELARALARKLRRPALEALVERQLYELGPVRGAGPEKTTPGQNRDART